MNIDLAALWNMSIDKHTVQYSKLFTDPFLPSWATKLYYIIEAKLISASTNKAIYYYIRMLPGHSVLSGL